MSTTINIFRRASDTIEFSANDVIFKEGDPGDLAYGIQDGEIAITLHGKEVDTAGPGSIIGEMALIDSQPRSASAIAKTDCKLVPVDQKRFTFLVQETPFFALNVMRIMAERMRRYMQAV
jgi:CRP-like cAMP-binding protein